MKNEIKIQKQEEISDTLYELGRSVFNCHIAHLNKNEVMAKIYSGDLVTYGKRLEELGVPTAETLATYKRAQAEALRTSPNRNGLFPYRFYETKAEEEQGTKYILTTEAGSFGVYASSKEEALSIIEG